MFKNNILQQYDCDKFKKYVILDFITLIVFMGWHTAKIYKQKQLNFLKKLTNIIEYN